MKGKLLQLARSIFPHKKALLGIAFLVLLFSVVPLEFAEANIFTDIATYILTLPFRLVAALLAVIVAFVAAILGFFFFILAGILGTFILGTLAPVIPGHGIGIVDVGWGFSRDLVNITFILILVFIGLATILRLQTYQLQKTLPALIVIALLVNFSGVFVGFVVDMANLVTKAFISQIAGFNIDALKNTIFEVPFNFLTSTLQKLFLEVGELTSVFGIIVGLVAYALSLLLFYAFGLFILVVVLLLFIVRTIILWTLVILAPIAFACYVLPATKKYWNQWLQQLIQWSIIGIPIGLFLLLGLSTFSGGVSGVDVSSVPSRFLEVKTDVSTLIPKFSATGFSPLQQIEETIINNLNSLFAAIMGPFVGLVLIMIGVMLSMQLAPAGAQGVINMGKKAGAGLGKFAGTAAWRRAGERVKKVGAGLKERGEKMGVAPMGAGFFQRSLAKGAKWTGAGLITRWAGRGIELGSEKITRTIKEQDAKRFGAAKSAGKDKDPNDNIDKIKAKQQLKLPLADADIYEMAGSLNITAENGDSDVINDRVEEIGGKSFIGKAIREGKRQLGPAGYRPLLKAVSGDLLINPEAYGFNPESAEYKKLKEEIATKATGQDFVNDVYDPRFLDPDTPQGNALLKHLVAERGSDFMPQFGRRPKKEESRKIMQFIFKEGSYAETGLGDDWLLEHGAESVLLYIDSPGARSLGIGTGRTRIQMDAKIAQWQQKKTKEDLLGEQARLEQERQALQNIPNRERTKGERTKLTGLGRHLREIEEAKQLMDVPLEGDQGLQKQIDDLQLQVREATDTIKKDDTNLEAYRQRAEAEQKLKPLQQELRRREVEQVRPAEEQMRDSLTARRQELERELSQLTAEAQGLESAIAQVLPESDALTGDYDQARRKLADLSPKLKQYRQQLERLREQEKFLEDYHSLTEYIKKVEKPRASATEQNQFSEIAGLGKGRQKPIPFSGVSAKQFQKASEDELGAALRKFHGAQHALASTLQERYKELQNLYQQHEQLRQDPQAHEGTIANVAGQISDIESRIRQHEARRSRIDEQESRIASEYNQRPKKATKKSGDDGGKRAPEIGDAFKP